MIDNLITDITVRQVTDEEIEFFFENGWVKLPGLIDRQAAANLLTRAKGIFGEDGRAGLSDEPRVTEGWQAWNRTKFGAHEDEHFRQLAHSSELGHNAARLLGRDSAMRVMVNTVMAKLPRETGKGNPTTFHQDTPGHAIWRGISSPPGSLWTK